MISPRTDPLGVAILEELAERQFDYIELSLRDAAELERAHFDALAKRIQQSGISCEACNNFFPARIRLTGHDADLAAALEYARMAIDKAAQLGAKIIVFGSSGAKNVPEGFPYRAAWEQIVALLLALGPIAAENSITIVIEPLNRKESNIVTLAREGLQLVREVGHPSVQLLIDYYHLTRENEDVQIVLDANSAIRHLHFAEGEARVFPTEERAEYAKFFDCLKRIQYAGRCSIEAYTNNFSSDAGRALATLKAAAEQMRS
jgi:sugar phosphate isomerase/epimerase